MLPRAAPHRLLLAGGLLALCGLAWLGLQARDRAARGPAADAPPRTGAALRPGVEAEPLAGAEQVPEPRRVPDSRALRGRVLDHRGAPVAGAEVRAWVLEPRRDPAGGVPRDGERAVRTDRGGRFALAGLPPAGAVRVLVRAEGLARAWREADEPAREGELDLGDVVLPPGATLVVQARDTGGRALEGIEVYALPEELADAPLRRLLPGEHGLPLLGLTGPGGELALPDQDALYALGVAGGGRVPRVLRGRLDGTARTAVRLVLEPGARIAGRVTGAERGSPQGLTALALRLRDGREGAWGALPVSAAGRLLAAGRRAAAPVEEDGSFALAGLPVELGTGDRVREGRTIAGVPQPVAYLVCAVDASGAVATEARLVAPDAKDVELSLAPPAAVRARTVDARSGAPVEVRAARLVPEPLEGDALQGLELLRPHDAAGALVLGEHERLATWTYRLELVATGYEDLVLADVAVGPGPVDLGELALEPRPVADVRLAWPRGAPAAGVALEARHFRPLPESLPDTWAGSPDETYRTGVDGRLRVFGHAGWTTVLHVPRTEEHAGSLPEHAWFDRRGADLADPVHVTVFRGGTVRGELRDRAGEPLEGRVGLVPRWDETGGDWGYLPLLRRAAETDEDGRFAFEHVLPGDYVVQARRKPTSDEALLAGFGFPPPPVDEPREVRDTLQRLVVVVEEGAVDVVLFEPPLCDLSGRAFLDGEPAGGARILLGIGDASAVTDAEGRFSLPGVEPGPHLVYGLPRGGQPTQPIPVDLPSGEAYVELDLGVTVRGRVVDAAGEPLEEVAVRIDQGLAWPPPPDASEPDWDQLARDDRLTRERRQRLQPLQWRRRGIVTDEEGRFRVAGLRADLPLRVRVGLDRDREHAWRFPPPARGTDLGELVVAEPGELVVDVLDPAERSWSYALELADVAEVERGRVRDRLLRFTRLQPGAYRLVLRASGDEDGAELGRLEATVAPGETTYTTLAP